MTIGIRVAIAHELKIRATKKVIGRGARERAAAFVYGAARDYNKALWAGDEVGVDDRALAGLTAINCPVEEYDPDEDQGED